jgi:integrase
MPLKLKKRGEIWHYTGTVAGRRLRGSCKTSQRAEAEKIANEVERKWLDRDRYGPGAHLTFAQAALEYRKLGKVPRYLELVEDYWKDTPVKDITRGALTRAAIALLPNGKGAYRNRAVIVPTCAVVNHAADLELCAPIRPKRFKEIKPKREPVTWEWVQVFMAHASPHLGALACFMFLTGARISEALGVRWRDIDLSSATAEIVMGKLGGETRTAHLPPELVAAMARIPGDRKPDERPFFYAGYGSCKDPWNLAIKRAGIKRLTPHSCRHGFATGMMHAGIDPVTVAEKGGWKSAEQLFRTYGHPRAEKGLSNVLTGTSQANGISRDAQVSEKQLKIG